MPKADRFSWAVEVMKVSPADWVLEIGCGRGVAVERVSLQLDRGKLLAIDRSEKMIQAATERNATRISEGQVELRVSTLEALDLGRQRFDKLFAINVNLFWTRDPQPELALCRRMLKPGGTLFLFWEAPGAAKAERIAVQVSAAMKRAGLRPQTVRGQASQVCVKAPAA